MLVILSMLMGVVAWIAATVFWGYAGLIVGALLAVLFAFAVMLGLTAGGLKAGSGGGH